MRIDFRAELRFAVDILYKVENANADVIPFPVRTDSYISVDNRQLRGTFEK